MIRRRTWARRWSGCGRFCNAARRNRHPARADVPESPAFRRGTRLAIQDGVANSLSPITLAPIRSVDRPLQDEWGIFDPEQAGLEALLRKLQSRPSPGDQPAPGSKK